MILPKDTFKQGRQYSKDEVTAHFADAEITEERRGKKNYIIVDNGWNKWTLRQNHNGKYELVVEP